MKSFALAAIAAALLTPALAQDGVLDRPHIAVTGQGEVAAAPDLVSLRFSVSTRAESAADAIAENREQAGSLRDRLADLGVEPRDMQTSELSVSPYYRQNERGQYDRSEIAGYEATNALFVRLRQIDRAGGVIDEAIRAGANGLENLSFGFQEEADLRAEARRAAVADARSVAELLADEAGASLGEVLLIEEYGQQRPMAMERMVAASPMMDSATPIEGGEQTLSASVRIVYALD